MNGINFEKIKINKKVLKRVLTGSVALTMLTSSLTACNNNYFTYEESSNGEIITSGTIGYDILKKCYYVEIYNSTCETIEYYIVSRYDADIYQGIVIPLPLTYRNVINDKIVFECTDEEEKNTEDDTNSRTIIKEECLKDYLSENNLIKEQYTLKDVEAILNGMKDKNTEHEKSLVKE